MSIKCRFTISLTDLGQLKGLLVVRNEIYICVTDFEQFIGLLVAYCEIRKTRKMGVF